VPTAATTSPPASARSFALAAAAWGLGLFALLRLPWVEAHLLLPLTRFQGGVAAAAGGTAVLPVDVTLACSGADVLAVCTGAILAYPVRWRARLAGAAAAILLILIVNTMRIGTLARTVGSPALFEALHVYVWPAVLALTAALFVFGWMRFADGAVAAPRLATPSRRFVVLAAVFIVVFAAASPFYLQSAGVLAVAAFIARAAAGVLRLCGAAALASGNVLVTARGAFEVTQECISTPLIPVYAAAVVAYGRTWKRRLPALVALVPIFVLLGIVRLLAVALPAQLMASPLFVMHAFYQLVCAAVLVCLVAFTRHERAARWGRAAAGIAAGAVALWVLMPLSAHAFATWPAAQDPQSALMLLPAFQIALLGALWIAWRAPIGWRSLAVALAVLAMSQIALWVAWHATAGLVDAGALVPPVRAWAVVVPALLLLVMERHARARA
jgi:exosortase/archaeosortase family protein